MTQKDDNVQDIFRDTPIRYLGYANEVGEAFRHFIGSKMVLMTYGIASMYVLADTCDKSWAVYNNDKSKLRTSRTVYTAMDTLIWQMLASVMIPGFTINRLCYFSSKFFRKMRFSSNVGKPMVTGIGLLAIPFIIRPIDHFTDYFMDETLRKFAP